MVRIEAKWCLRIGKRSRNNCQTRAYRLRTLIEPNGLPPKIRPPDSLVNNMTFKLHTANTCANQSNLIRWKRDFKATAASEDVRRFSAWTTEILKTPIKEYLVALRLALLTHCCCTCERLTIPKYGISVTYTRFWLHSWTSEEAVKSDLGKEHFRPTSLYDYSSFVWESFQACYWEKSHIVSIHGPDSRTILRGVRELTSRFRLAHHHLHPFLDPPSPSTRKPC